MFESDDYDQVLSQIDFPELCAKLPSNNQVPEKPIVKCEEFFNNSTITNKENSNKDCENFLHDIFKTNIKQTVDNESQKHTKRKIINAHFDQKSKRKFPGPAGFLSGNFEEKKNDDVCYIELLSQDVDFTQNYLQGNVFESPLWKRLLEDTASCKEVNSINDIKHQALTGNLHRKKAQYVIAFVECVDRSAVDPLVTLRDKTGNIKCTLHRDAWTAFSPYIVSEYCALVLCKPTVLTTGSAFKKHYLNITLSNILIIYSSAILNDNETDLPDGYKKICEDDYTIVKIDKTENVSSNESVLENVDFLEDLDNVFSDDLF